MALQASPRPAREVGRRIPRRENAIRVMQFSPSPAKRGQGAGGWGPSAGRREVAPVRES
jgi:hypothetical protein